MVRGSSQRRLDANGVQGIYWTSTWESVISTANPSEQGPRAAELSVRSRAAARAGGRPSRPPRRKTQSPRARPARPGACRSGSNDQLTVTPVEPETLVAATIVAVIVAVPLERAVASPLEVVMFEIVTTTLYDEVQLTCEVRFCVEPSL